MSSAAATRTSTGNVTARPVPSTAPRTRRNTSRSAARGTAYSISRKRTRRGVQNTRYERSTYSASADGPADDAR